MPGVSEHPAIAVISVGIFWSAQAMLAPLRRQHGCRIPKQGATRWVPQLCEQTIPTEVNDESHGDRPGKRRGYGGIARPSQTRTEKRRAADASQGDFPE